MLLVLCGIISTLGIAYVIYTLITSYGSDYSDNSLDAFIIENGSTEQGSMDSTACGGGSNQYLWSYTSPGKQLLILYGTEYGCSKEIAQELYDRVIGVTDNGSQWQPRIVNAKHFDLIDFCRETLVLVIISTAGDGVAPTDAREFVQWLTTKTDEDCFSHLNYSVLALGDSNYLYFCRAGRTVDDRFLSLGAKQIVCRRDVDAEDRQTINEWIDSVLEVLDSVSIDVKMDYLCSQDFDCSSLNGPSREYPFLSILKVKQDLTHRLGDDDKETIHCEFDVTDSGIKWTAGDALGIYPQNCFSTVNYLLNELGWTGFETVSLPTWAYNPKPDGFITVRHALIHYYDVKNLKPELLLTLQKYSSEDSSSKLKLDNLLENGLYKGNSTLMDYLSGRELVDIIEDFKDVMRTIPLEGVMKQLKMLQPRYYSISSSPLQNPCVVCVTAAVVRYRTRDHDRIGVTTTFLQDRLSIGQSCPVFISRNPDFRLPSDGSLPIIMIGPGTGLAPFRAFIQERILTNSTGLNILYFGCRRQKQDFLYKDQLEHWMEKDKLVLRTAFSRDQNNKVYVQDLLRADADKIWLWLKECSAHLYVCGDAKHMASDVHCALVDIVKNKGSFNEDNALSFLSQLESLGRYQKDVWL